MIEIIDEFITVVPPIYIHGDVIGQRPIIYKKYILHVNICREIETWMLESGWRCIDSLDRKMAFKMKFENDL